MQVADREQPAADPQTTGRGPTGRIRASWLSGDKTGGRMNATSHTRSAIRWALTSLALAAGAYAAYVAAAWYRYGHPSPAVGPEERDDLLDRFMPTYEVAERPDVRVAAPADVTFAAAREMDLQRSSLTRAIFKGRELLLGATPDPRPRPRGLLAEMQSLGWGVLAEAPNREIVVGAATRPWEPNVTFRALPPDRFAVFDEPDYVKIAWTLRADSIGPNESIFRTEPRVVATDSRARTRFRTYWCLLSPGIIAIRWAMLGSLKRDAERRARGVQVVGLTR